MMYALPGSYAAGIWRQSAQIIKVGRLAALGGATMKRKGICFSVS